MQGDQGLADYCQSEGFTIINKGAPATQIGLDIGTVLSDFPISVLIAHGSSAA